MKTLPLALGCLMLAGTPAAAQQVVEMPSINAMIEQNIEESRARPPIDTADAKEKERYERERAEAEREIARTQEREKAAEEKRIAKELRDRQKIEERRHKELVKAIKRASKPKKYKPLKKVRTLPPNSKAY